MAPSFFTSEPTPETVPPSSYCKRPVDRIEPTLTSEIVPALETVLSVSMPPISRMAPEVIATGTSPRRESVAVASLPPATVIIHIVSEVLPPPRVSVPAPVLVRLPLLIVPLMKTPLVVFGVLIVIVWFGPMSPNVPLKVSCPTLVVAAPRVTSPLRLTSFAKVKAEAPFAMMLLAPPDELTFIGPEPKAALLPAMIVP